MQVYVMVFGAEHVIDIDEKETIGGLKKILQERTGIDASEIKLTHFDEILRNDLLIADYMADHRKYMMDEGARRFTMSHFQPAEIRIGTFTGKQFSVEITAKDTVFTLKQKIEQQTGANVESQSLIFENKIMNNADKLMDYRLSSTEFLRLSIARAANQLPVYNALPVEFRSDLSLSSKKARTKLGGIDTETYWSSLSSDQKSQLWNKYKTSLQSESSSSSFDKDTLLFDNLSITQQQFVTEEAARRGFGEIPASDYFDGIPNKERHELMDQFQQQDRKPSAHVERSVFKPKEELSYKKLSGAQKDFVKAAAEEIGLGVVPMEEFFNGIPNEERHKLMEKFEQENQRKGESSNPQ